MFVNILMCQSEFNGVEVNPMLQFVGLCLTKYCWQSPRIRVLHTTTLARCYSWGKRQRMRSITEGLFYIIPRLTRLLELARSQLTLAEPLRISLLILLPVQKKPSEDNKKTTDRYSIKITSNYVNNGDHDSCNATQQQASSQELTVRPSLAPSCPPTSFKVMTNVCNGLKSTNQKTVFRYLSWLNIN